MPRRHNINQDANPFAVLPGNGGSSSSAFEDTTSPYYLHHADHPGLILVQHSLDGFNYISWSMAMQMAFEAKNKAVFLDGSEPIPADGDLLYPAWRRVKSMLKSWIMNTVSKEISSSLLYIRTVTKVWTELRNRYSQSNRPRVYQLKKTLASLHQGSLSVTSYYTQLKTLCDELREYQPRLDGDSPLTKAWVDYLAEELVLQFLMGINDSYAPLRAQMLTMEPFLNLTKVFSLAIQEERQRSLTPASPLISDLPIFTDDSINDVQLFPVPTRKSPCDRYFCTHCKVHGHSKECCFKLHSYPANWMSKPRSPAPVSINQASGSFASDQSSHTLSSSQYDDLVALLNPPAQPIPSTYSDSIQPGLISNFSGSYEGSDDWDG